MYVYIYVCVCVCVCVCIYIHFRIKVCCIKTEKDDQADITYQLFNEH